MKQTLKNIKWLRPGLKRLLQLKICFLFATLVLSGCQSLAPFPTDKIFEVDTDNKACGVYQITIKSEEVVATHIQDLPLESCNGVFGFSTESTPKVIRWAQQAIKKAKECCK